MEELDAMVVYARRVAMRMSNDPEAESRSATTAWRACMAYDPTMNVPLKRWVAVCVRRMVWDMWRRKAKKREENKPEVWWEKVYSRTEEPSSEFQQTNAIDWLLLTERHFDRLPIDVMARKHRVTVAAMRVRLVDAEANFVRAMK